MPAERNMLAVMANVYIELAGFIDPSWIGQCRSEISRVRKPQGSNRIIFCGFRCWKQRMWLDSEYTGLNSERLGLNVAPGPTEWSVICTCESDLGLEP